MTLKSHNCTTFRELSFVARAFTVVPQFAAMTVNFNNRDSRESNCVAFGNLPTSFIEKPQ